MNYRRNCDKTHCIAAHFAYSLTQGGLRVRGPSLRTMGFGNVAEDQQDTHYATTRPLQGAPIASSPALAADSWRRGGSPGPELRADGRQRPVARRRGVGPGRGRRHVAPGPARPGVVQGRLDPYRQPQPCSARARQRRGPPPRPGDHAQALRRAAGRRAALPARPCRRCRPVVQPQPTQGQRRHLLHDLGDSRHRVRDPRRAGPQPAHRVRGRGAGEQRPGRGAGTARPVGGGHARPAAEAVPGGTAARRRAMVAVLSADLLRPARQRSGPRGGAAAGGRQ